MEAGAALIEAVREKLVFMGLQVGEHLRFTEKEKYTLRVFNNPCQKNVRKISVKFQYLEVPIPVSRGAEHSNRQKHIYLASEKCALPRFRVCADVLR